MKISKKLKSVEKINKDSEFVDKWGRQYKRLGLHFCFYMGVTGYLYLGFLLITLINYGELNKQHRELVAPFLTSLKSFK